MTSAPLIMRVLATSVSAASRAGGVIRDILASGELGIHDKGVGDLQTQADRSAQFCIVSTLEKAYPGLKVIGEEKLDSGEKSPKGFNIEEAVNESNDSVLSSKCPNDLSSVKMEDVVVWVDPLDGTNEFTQGLFHHVTVLIGLSVLGKSVGGVIYQPFHKYKLSENQKIGDISNASGRCIWGLEGLGAFGLESSDASPLSQSPSFDSTSGEFNNVVCTTRSHGDGDVLKAVDSCKPSKIVRVGGCGYKVLMLMERESHAYVFASPGCSKWDTCAPEAILHAFGGKLTDIKGDQIKYYADVQRKNTKGVLATSVADWHSTYQKMIPGEILN